MLKKCLEFEEKDRWSAKELEAFLQDNESKFVEKVVVETKEEQPKLKSSRESMSRSQRKKFN